MIIIFGERSCGRVYNNKNELVSTFFTHFYYIPLFPVRSIIVTNRGLFIDEGESLPLYWKSVLAYYFRSFFLVMTMLGFGMLYAELFTEKGVDDNTITDIKIGMFFFGTSYFLWLLSQFAWGAPRSNKDGVGYALSRILIGLGIGVVILTIMFSISSCFFLKGLFFGGG